MKTIYSSYLQKRGQRPQDAPFVQFNYKPADADWGREMRGMTLLTVVDLREWAVLFTDRDAPKAQDFVQTMSKVGPGMGINVSDPGT